MSDSGEQQVPGYDNSGTIVVDARHILHRRPVPLENLWDAHWDAIFSAFEQGRGSGYAIVLFDDLANIHATATLSQPTGELANTMTIGRHTQCGLHVVGDAAVALRQLVLAVAPGSERLEVLDLRTEAGFIIDGIGPARSAVVDGAISLTFAGIRLLALPLHENELWPVFPHHARQQFFGKPAIRATLELPRNPAAHCEPLSSGTIVSVVEPVLQLEELEPQWTDEESIPVGARPALPEGGASEWKRPTEGSGSKQLELLFGEVENAADFDDGDDDANQEPPNNVVFLSAWRARNAANIRLTLEGPRGRAVMTLSDQELVRGILIGRYERCAGHVNGHVFDEHVSRVHALLKRDAEGQIVLFDTGSTFGVYVEGVKTARAALARGQRAWLSTRSSLSYEELQ